MYLEVWAAVCALKFSELLFQEIFTFDSRIGKYKYSVFGRWPVAVHHFQRSSPLKPLGQSKPNFT